MRSFHRLNGDINTSWPFTSCSPELRIAVRSTRIQQAVNVGDNVFQVARIGWIDFVVSDTVSCYVVSRALQNLAVGKGTISCAKAVGTWRAVWVFVIAIIATVHAVATRSTYSG